VAGQQGSAGSVSGAAVGAYDIRPAEEASAPPAKTTERAQIAPGILAEKVSPNEQKARGNFDSIIIAEVEQYRSIEEEIRRNNIRINAIDTIQEKIDHDAFKSKMLQPLNDITGKHFTVGPELVKALKLEKNSLEATNKKLRAEALQQKDRFVSDAAKELRRRYAAGAEDNTINFLSPETRISIIEDRMLRELEGYKLEGYKNEVKKVAGEQEAYKEGAAQIEERNKTNIKLEVMKQIDLSNVTTKPVAAKPVTLDFVRQNLRLAVSSVIKTWSARDQADFLMKEVLSHNGVDWRGVFFSYYSDAKPQIQEEMLTHPGFKKIAFNEGITFFEMRGISPPISKTPAKKHSITPRQSTNLTDILQK
jgi:hypothetical protein